MADAGKNAITTYASYDGSDTLTIGFSYLDKDYVQVTSNATTPDTTYTRGTDFDINNSDPTVIEWETGKNPATGVKVTITRVTKKDEPIVTYTAGKPVLAADLNTNLTQVLHYMQEVEDKQ